MKRYFSRSPSSLWVPAPEGTSIPGGGAYVGYGQAIPDWTAESFVNYLLRMGAIMQRGFEKCLTTPRKTCSAIFPTQQNAT